MKKIVLCLIVTLMLSLTACGKVDEKPIAGVSISGAENKVSGFTYIYDLGNGYKLYCDNLTMIVYLVKDFEDGRGATSVGSSSICPYISPNGYYYKIDAQTRVISEVIPNYLPQGQVNDKIEEITENKTENTEQSNSEKEDIEAILNENAQKNQNANVEQNTTDN